MTVRYRYLGTTPEVMRPSWRPFSNLPMFLSIQHAISVMRTWSYQERSVVLSDEIDDDEHIIRPGRTYDANPFEFALSDEKVLDLYTLTQTGDGDDGEWRVVSDVPDVRLSFGPRGGVVVERW